MYEQHINTTVSGLETAEKAVNVTGQLADRTQRLSQIITERIAGDEKLIGKHLDLIKTETTLEGLRERHRMQQESLAAASSKAAGAQEKHNAALKHTVSDVQAASASLRAMEGHIPIRAVEQFTTKILGMGGAFQALFPAVGAIAAVGVLEQMVGKVGALYNAWNPVLTAQEKSLKILQDSNREFDGLIKKSNQYRLDQYEREHGRPARLRLEAGEASGDAAYNDAARVAYIQGQIAKQEKIRDGAAPWGGALSRGLTGAGPLGLAAGVALGSVSTSLQRDTARETLVGLYGQLEEAQLQQKVDLQKAADLRAKAGEAENKGAGRGENIAASVRKRATEAMESSYFGSGDIGKAAYDQVKIRVEEEDAVRREDQAASLEHRPSQAHNIRASYTLLKAAVNQKRRDTEAAHADKLEEERLGLQDVGVSSIAKLVRTDLAEERHDTPELRALIGVAMPATPGGYVSPTQQLRDVRDQQRRFMSLSRVTGQLQGQSEGDQIAGQAGQRIRFADLEYQAQLRINAAKLHGTEKEIADADALDAKREKVFDAQMQREQSLLEIALKQKEGFQSLVVGFVKAARTGNVGGFVRGQIEGLGDKVISNAAGMAWESVSKVIPHASGTLGKLLEGTPFGPDPTKAAQQDNTLATRANTDATNNLTAALTGGTVTGGGAGGGIAGVGGGGSGSSTASLPAAISGISKTLGTIAKYGGAAFGAYEGISTLAKGGARNTVTGIGELAGAAALVDPEPISKAVLGIVAGATTLISGFLGDPRANRSSAIQKMLQTNQFMDPAHLDVSMTTGGTFSDYDRFGGVRGSGLSPFPTVQQGFFDYRNGVTVQGRTVSAFGGGPAPQTNVTIQAWDGADVRRVLERHVGILGDVLNGGIQSGRAGTGLSETLHGN